MKHLPILLLLVGLVLTSCRTREQAYSQSVQQVHTDTLRIFQLRADTLRLRDSIFVREQIVGETIRIEKHHYHTDFRTHLMHDTIYATKTDTIHVVDKSSEIISYKSPFSFMRYVILVVVICFLILFIKRLHNGNT